VAARRTTRLHSAEIRGGVLRRMAMLADKQIERDMVLIGLVLRSTVPRDISSHAPQACGSSKRVGESQVSSDPCPYGSSPGGILCGVATPRDHALKRCSFLGERGERGERAGEHLAASHSCGRPETHRRTKWQRKNRRKLLERAGSSLQYYWRTGEAACPSTASRNL
jgi:hypothetical protein